MLGEKYNLTDMIGIVRELPVDGLQHGVRFTTDGDGALHIFWAQRFDGREYERPARFPPAHDIVAGRFGNQLEFLVTMAVRLLTVGAKKIAEARTHVASHVLDDNRRRIRFGIERKKQLFVLQLSEGTLAEPLVAAKLPAGFFKIVLGKLSHTQIDVAGC